MIKSKSISQSRPILFWCMYVCLLLAGCRHGIQQWYADAERAEQYAREFYVAPDGDDAADGSIAKPFATLERARSEIRRIKHEVGLPVGGVAVFVRGGRYELERTLEFTAEDRGNERSPVVYRAYGNEKPVLTGGRRVTDFQPYQGAIVKADVAAQGLKGKYFRHIFFNGERQPLARYPDYDPNNPHGSGFAYVEGPIVSMYRNLTNETRRVVQCKPKDFRNWANPEGGEIFIYPRYNWRSCRVPIATLDRDQGQIILARDVWSGESHTIRAGDRYYVRNFFEELDAPGEWYLDKDTWTLYFWPPAEQENIAVEASAIKDLIQVGPGAAWLTLQGFEITCSDGVGVIVRDSTNCLVAANQIRGIGGYAAVRIQGGANCAVIGNDIWDTCHQGVVMDGGSAETLEPGGHVVENNYIHHIGALNGHAAGVMMRGIGLRVAHNLIHDTTRSGIYGGGNDCIVEYNHIRHTNLATEDTAGYYNGGNWHIRGQIIRYNFIHDTLGYGRKRDGTWGWPHASCCIYLDDDHSGTTVYGNILARSVTGGVFVHGGRDNHIENNILVNHDLRQVTYSGHAPTAPVVAKHLETFKRYKDNPAYAKYPEVPAMDLDTAWQMAGNQFVRNIIYYRDPESKLYGLRRHDIPEKNVFDYNLIWSFGNKIDTGYKPASNDKNSSTEEAQADSWSTWRADCFDKHSIVADPMFINPEKDDYRLKPGSPALKLGFKPIPVDRIGLYRSKLRATWPVAEAVGVRELGLPTQ
ncbi:MAG: right-handed parallel beta-helix repeat-containing protein [Kiritimatiellia bacterium]